MRRATYLNVVLTINAVLLAALLWSAVAGRPLFSTEAAAQSRTRYAEVPNVPNAGEQRAEMVAALKDLKQSVEATNRLLSSGVRVVVTNPDEIRGK
jgi:hypothetical protein